MLHRAASAICNSHVRCVLVVLAVALLARIIYIGEIASYPFFELHIGDAKSYHTWAREILDVNWVGNEVFYQAPLYPYLLSLIYMLFGDGKLVVAIFQVLLSAASCLFLYSATTRFFNQMTGVIAGLMFALYGPAIFFDGLIQKASLGVFLISAMIWIISRQIQQERDSRWIVLGVVFGLLALTRETSLILAPVLIVWTLVHFSGSWSERFKRAAILLTGAAVVLAPVVARNWVVGGELHLTTSQFGPNFYIGNNPNASGSYSSLRYSRGDAQFERRDATEIAEYDVGRRLSPAEVSRYWTERSWSYIQSQPWSWLKLMGKKFAMTWNAVEISDTEGMYAYSDFSVCLALTSRFFHFGVLAPLAALGIACSWPRRRDLWILYLILAAYAFGTTLFFVLGRYRLPLTPVLIVFSAYGCAEFWNLVKSSSWRAVGWRLVLVGVVAAGCNWPINDTKSMRSITYYNFGVESDRDLNYAMMCYSKTLELNPNNEFAHFNLANCLSQDEQLDLAEVHFLAALKENPEFLLAHYHYGRLMLEQDKLQEALDRFERVLKLDEEYALAHMGIGVVYLKFGDQKKASTHFNEAMNIDPLLGPVIERERENDTPAHE